MTAPDPLADRLEEIQQYVGGLTMQERNYLTEATARLRAMEKVVEEARALCGLRGDTTAGDRANLWRALAILDKAMPGAPR